MTRRLLLLTLPAIALAAAAPAASASEMVAKDVRDASLEVNGRGEALIRYTQAGERRRVLAWGAVNARKPTRDRKQVHFRYDYSVTKAVYRSFSDRCGRYTGPPLAVRTAACTMPDGSHWALQEWRRLNKNGGWTPLRPRELHLSHWTGELPKLWLKFDWNYAGASSSWAPYDHFYGRYTYRGNPVYGFSADRYGNPEDTYGRNIYVDTYGSPWGRGWKRLNGFLSHRPRGNFCDAAYPNRYGREDAGRGTRYRATTMGPGVTPIVRWQGPPPGPYAPGTLADPLDFVLRADHRLDYDAALDEELDQEQKRIAGESDTCFATH